MYSIHARILGSIATRDAIIHRMLGACIEYNSIIFDERPFPWLYDMVRSGRVVYRTTGCDEDSCVDVPWEDPWTIISRGWTDCKNFVTWRIVELRERKGLNVEPIVMRATNDLGDVIYHPRVKGFYAGRTRIEDPSVNAGMGTEGSIIHGSE